MSVIGYRWRKRIPEGDRHTHNRKSFKPFLVRYAEVTWLQEAVASKLSVQIKLTFFYKDDPPWLMKAQGDYTW